MACAKEFDEGEHNGLACAFGTGLAIFHVFIDIFVDIQVCIVDMNLLLILHASVEGIVMRKDSQFSKPKTVGNAAEALENQDPGLKLLENG